MSVDLLKLDKDCAMPNLLRAKWKALYGYDPLTAKRRQDFFACTALVGLLVVFFMILLGGAIFQSNMLVIIGVILIPVTTVLALPCSLFGKQSSKFADALEKVASALSTSDFFIVPFTSLHQFHQAQLEAMAKDRMLDRVRELIKAEHKHAQAVTNGVNRELQEELGRNVVRHRQELSYTHKALRAFQLVDKDWTPYFAAVKQELAPGKAQETPPEDKNDDPLDARARQLG